MKGATVSALANTLTLDQIAAATRGSVRGGGARTVAGVSIDSRTLAKGQLFVAVKGPKFDGHDFLAGALEKGAGAAMVHRDVEVPPSFPLVRVTDTTQALKDLSRQVRLEAVRALGTLRPARAVEPLLRLLDQDAEAQVRYEGLALDYLYRTRDHAEAVRAFKEKRRPVFEGR